MVTYFGRLIQTICLPKIGQSHRKYADHALFFVSDAIMAGNELPDAKTGIMVSKVICKAHAQWIDPGNATGSVGRRVSRNPRRCMGFVNRPEFESAWGNQ
jgi:hypothetical protein